MIKVSDKIYIDLDSVPTDVNVLGVLRYQNPDYYQKINMGISVYGIPKEIWSYEVEGRELRIMRGEALKIKPFFPSQWVIEFKHPNHPVSLQYINNDFPLDEFQEEAVTTMKNKRQGIIHAVTSAGKSLIICKAIAEIGQRALIVVYRKILMDQLLEDIDKYIRDEKGNKVKVGIIGGGKNTIGDITIAIDKTLSRKIDMYKESFGTVILDECHLAPANTIFSLLNNLNSKYRFGLTGTLVRKDGKQFLIYSTFGEVIYTISKEQLLGKERIVPVHLEVIRTNTRFDWDHVVLALTEEGNKNPTQAARHLQDQTIANDPNRRELVLVKAKELHDQGKKIIILSRFVGPCVELQKEFSERYGIESGIITGKDSKRGSQSYSDMKHGDLKVIFATIGCVSTGVSISDLDDVILISPVLTNELLIHQIRGRLMRNFEGKDYGTLWLLFDQYIFPEKKLREFVRIINK